MKSKNTKPKGNQLMYIVIRRGNYAKYHKEIKREIESEKSTLIAS